MLLDFAFLALSLLSTLLVAIGVAFVARRLLGSTVGWVRTLVMVLIMLVATAPVLTWLGNRVGLFSPAGITVEPVTVVIVLVLALAWMFALGTAVLVVAEALLPTGSIPGPVEAIRRWRDRRRTSRRVRQVVAIAVRNGLGGFLRGRAPEQPTSRVTLALTRTLEQAGVAFVKVGQLASTRPDLVGADFARALSVLRTDVRSEPWEAVRQVLIEALPGPIEDYFSELEERPLAAASVAQVHRARLVSGEEVVIKIQRPQARQQVEQDLQVLASLARWLQRNTGWGKDLGVARLADGFSSSLYEELDYRLERANMDAIAAQQTDHGQIRIPRTYPEVSSARVLVMERVEGVDLGHAEDQLTQLGPRRRTELARALVADIMRQMLISGTFHADLHPGNILLSQDRCYLLDFGSVGRLDRHSRRSLVVLLGAVENGDARAATDSLIDLLGRPTELDERGFERELGEVITRIDTGSSESLFADLFGLLRRHHYAVPNQIAAAFRSFMALEGTLALVQPEESLVAVARQQAAEVSVELTETTVQQTWQDQLLTLVPMMERLPRRLDRLTEQLTDGRFSAKVRLLADAEDRRYLTGLVHQAILGILAAALTVASVVLLASSGGPELAPGFGVLTVLGSAILFVAFMLGLRVLVVIFRGSERE